MNRPKLQLALDTFDLPSALVPLQRAAAHIDVVECGTILCLSEGMHAVRALRSLFPDKILLADVRIAEAGSIISKLAFDAGADWVSVVSGAAPDSVAVVLRESQTRGREMQIELSDGWTWSQVERWAEMGVPQVIFKRSRDAEAQGKLDWGDEDIQQIQRLSTLGFKVSVAGSVKVDDVPRFAEAPVYTFIVGRAICQADDPAVAAANFQQAIAATYPAE